MVDVQNHGFTKSADTTAQEIAEWLLKATR